MAVWYDYSKCRDYESWTDRDKNNVNDLIASAGWAVGISGITEKNVAEYAYRLYVCYEFRILTPINYVPDDEPVTNENGYRMPWPNEVYDRAVKFIGLKTNHTPLTEAEWWKWIRKRTENSTKRGFTRMHTGRQEKVSA